MSRRPRHNSKRYLMAREAVKGGQRLMTLRRRDFGYSSAFWGAWGLARRRWADVDRPVTGHRTAHFIRTGHDIEGIAGRLRVSESQGWPAWPPCASRPKSRSFLAPERLRWSGPTPAKRLRARCRNAHRHQGHSDRAADVGLCADPCGHGRSHHGSVPARNAQSLRIAEIGRTDRR